MINFPSSLDSTVHRNVQTVRRPPSNVNAAAIPIAAGPLCILSGNSHLIIESLAIFPCRQSDSPAPLSDSDQELLQRPHAKSSRKQQSTNRHTAR